jgi:MoxR-like ATPase
MTNLEQAINTLEHVSTTSLPAPQMRRILRELLLKNLYPALNEERKTYDAFSFGK